MMKGQIEAEGIWGKTPLRSHLRQRHPALYVLCGQVVSDTQKTDRSQDHCISVTCGVLSTPLR